MNRTEKAATVESLKEQIAKCNAIFLTEYRGLNALQTANLRAKVRAGGGQMVVVKNRLAKIAVKGTKFEHLMADLKGPIALALSTKDAVSVAKALNESLEKDSPFNIKLGSLDGSPVASKQIDALAKLPDRNTLLAMMLSAMQGPMRNFAGVMAAVPRDFVNVLSNLKDKKRKSCLIAAPTLLTICNFYRN